MSHPSQAPGTPFARLTDVEFLLEGEAVRVQWRGLRAPDGTPAGHWEVSANGIGPLPLILPQHTTMVALGKEALSLVHAFRQASEREPSGESPGGA